MGDIAVGVESGQVAVADGRGTLTVTVTSGAAERVVLGAFRPAAASGAADPAWVSVDRPLRQVQADAPEQYAVTVTPPASVAPGTYDVKFIAYPADKAPEEYADSGQTVRVAVPAAAPAPERKKRWWIWALAAVVGLAAIGAVAFYLMRPTTVAVPDVVEQEQAAAEAAIAGAGLGVRVDEEFGPRPFGVVADQLPRAGARVDPGTDVLITVRQGITLTGLQGLSVDNALALLGARLGVEVAGLSVADAQAALADRLAVDVTYQISGTAAGTVLDVQTTDVAAVAAGDAVTLVVAANVVLPDDLIEEQLILPDPQLLERFRDLIGP